MPPLFTSERARKATRSPTDFPEARFCFRLLGPLCAFLMVYYSRMPTSIAITPKVLEYLSLIVFGIIATTFLVTRIFYVRRIAKCKATVRTLEQQALELHSKVRLTETKLHPAPAAKTQQFIAVIVALGSLSALVAASTQFLHESMNSESCTASLRQTKESVDKLKGILIFDERRWAVAEDSVIAPEPSSQKQSFKLGEHRIDNSGKGPISITYDGLSPAIIDSDKSVTINMTLKKPATGVRLLIRPIRAPGVSK